MVSRALRSLLFALPCLVACHRLLPFEEQQPDVRWPGDQSARLDQPSPEGRAFPDRGRDAPAVNDSFAEAALPLPDVSPVKQDKMPPPDKSPQTSDQAMPCRALCQGCCLIPNCCSGTDDCIDPPTPAQCGFGATLCQSCPAPPACLLAMCTTTGCKHAPDPTQNNNQCACSSPSPYGCVCCAGTCCEPKEACLQKMGKWSCVLTSIP